MVITRAAIMFQNGEILEGYNYGQISILADKLSLRGEKVCGFMTSFGEFVLADEAVSIALKAKQISEKFNKLTPEMLWPQLMDD